MKEHFELIEHFNVPPSKIYNAWLNSEIHSAMTGGKAQCSTRVGGSFSSWDGYIYGTNKKLIENSLIIQSWRTTEFLEEHEDSLIEIHLSQVDNGTKLTLKHSNIPQGQTQYLQGWKDHYFAPMKDYFNKI